MNVLLVHECLGMMKLKQQRVDDLKQCLKLFNRNINSISDNDER